MGTARAPAATDSLRRPTVAPLRAPRRLAASLLLAPAASLAISQPADGTVTASDRLFVRLQGPANGPANGKVALEIDGELYAESALRRDGSQDFLSIPLEPGTHRIVARTTDGPAVLADSIRVHVSGAPVRFALDSTTLAIATDTRSVVRVSVLDEWDVPVSNRPLVSVAVRGAALVSEDEDGSSLGTQLRVLEDGAVYVALRADSTGVGALALEAGGLRETYALRIVPQARPVIVTGAGHIGAGATTRAYGALTARGMLTDDTRLTLSWDSRRDALRDEHQLGGGHDPLDESRYPTAGDRSRAERLAGTSALSLKLERGLGWVAVGDVDARGFGTGRELTSWLRTMRGASTQTTRGPLTVHGFGSVTSQEVVQRQLRGDGTSGPYDLGGLVVGGSERLTIETRDRLNAARVVGTRTLARYVDYDLDYQTGTILLRQPLPPTDPSGNPLYLVSVAERAGLGLGSAVVAGVRARMDVLASGKDSLVVGGTWIEDRVGLGGGRLQAAETELRWRGITGSAEVARAEMADSSGLAFRADAAWATEGDRVGLGLQWMNVGDGFYNPGNPRLVSGVQDLQLSGRLRLSDSLTAGLRHQRQSFASHAAERTFTGLQLNGRALGAGAALDLGLAEDRLARPEGDSWSRSLTARLRVDPARRLGLWVEASRPLEGSADRAQPTTIGAGAEVEVARGLRFTTSHRVGVTDTARYSVSAVGMKTELPTGTTVGAELQRNLFPQSASEAAMLSLGQRLQIRRWTANAQFSRRAGLDAAPLTDPARGLPFPAAEPDRWTGSLALAFNAGEGRTLSASGEVFGGEQGDGFRMLLIGETRLSDSWALLGRSDLRAEHRLVNTGRLDTRAFRSMAGLAYRPVGRSDLNLLARAEWRSDLNPLRLGAVPTGGRDRRAIGVLEGIWTPDAATELGARYGLRAATLEGALAGDLTIAARAHFGALRLRRDLGWRFDARGTGRVLTESETGATRWDATAGLGFRIARALDLEAGWRFGSLWDRDFASEQGTGGFVALGFRMTEHDAADLAGFWRRRTGGQD